MSKRLFSDKHLWVLLDGEKATIGISEYAQKRLGAVMFVNLPDVGETIESGQRFGDIESIKTVSDLISPVKGEIIKVNEELLDEPDMINEDPYGSWLVEVRVDSLPDDLMDEESYQVKKDEF